jgi:predicted ATP-binding protein involved in virulence
MRVLAVQIWDHPGFGHLEVDLSGSDGRASRLVVVAGENGCGKTAILEAIFNALAPGAFLLNTQRRLAPGRYRVLIENRRPKPIHPIQRNDRP